MEVVEEEEEDDDDVDDEEEEEEEEEEYDDQEEEDGSRGDDGNGRWSRRARFARATSPSRQSKNSLAKARKRARACV